MPKRFRYKKGTFIFVCAVFAIFLWAWIIYPPSISAQSTPWILQGDKDKTIFRLDDLPIDYKLEFWYHGEAPVVTKDELIAALLQYQKDPPFVATTTTAAIRCYYQVAPGNARPCVLGDDGVILNYPC